MTDPVPISELQVLRFMRFAGNGATLSQNARPLQPIMSRSLDYEL